MGSSNTSSSPAARPDTIWTCALRCRTAGSSRCRTAVRHSSRVLPDCPTCAVTPDASRRNANRRCTRCVRRDLRLQLSASRIGAWSDAQRPPSGAVGRFIPDRRSGGCDVLGCGERPGRVQGFRSDAIRIGSRYESLTKSFRSIPGWLSAGPNRPGAHLEEVRTVRSTDRRDRDRDVRDARIASPPSSTSYQANLQPVALKRSAGAASGQLTLTLNRSQATISEHVSGWRTRCRRIRRRWTRCGIPAAFAGKPFPHVQHIHINGAAVARPPRRRQR